MFNRVETFVLGGGAAGSVGTEHSNTTANNTAASDLPPIERRMKRTKRKRDEPFKDNKRTEEGEDAGSNAESPFAKAEGEPPVKKSNTSDEAPASLLTTFPKAADPETAALDDAQTPSHKRRHSDSADDDGIPMSRRRQYRRDFMDAPQCAGDAENLDGEAEEDALLHQNDDTPTGAGDDLASSSSKEPSGDDKNTFATDLTSRMSAIARRYRKPAASRLRASRGNADLQILRHLRRQAKRYLKQIRADRKSHEAALDGGDEDEMVTEIGAWLESSGIPGALRPEPADAVDKIELPYKKPHRSDPEQSVALNGARCAADVKRSALVIRVG